MLYNSKDKANLNLDIALPHQCLLNFKFSHLNHQSYLFHLQIVIIDLCL